MREALIASGKPARSSLCAAWQPQPPHLQEWLRHGNQLSEDFQSEGAVIQPEVLPAHSHHQSVEYQVCRGTGGLEAPQFSLNGAWGGRYTGNACSKAQARWKENMLLSRSCRDSSHILLALAPGSPPQLFAKQFLSTRGDLCPPHPPQAQSSPNSSTVPLPRAPSL